MPSPFPIIAAMSDMMTGALSVVAAMVISFVAIMLVASYYRFLHIVKMAENTQPEEMGASLTDILRVQLARYLTGCSRRGSSFSLALIKVNPSVEVRIDSPLIRSIKKAARHDDVTCLFDDCTAAVLMEQEPEDAVGALARVVGQVVADGVGVPAGTARVGISAYPGHGQSGAELMEAAEEALKQTDDETPIFIPEIIEIDEDEEEEDVEAAEDEGAEEEIPEEPASPVEDDGEEDGESGDDEDEDDEDDEERKSWGGRRKTSMLDELTGVLKPSAVSSYMQRTMNDFRHKKKKAALFCIGVNNMDYIQRFHGEQAVDDILVGISKILQDNVRVSDLIGRHEKHAFLILAEVSLEGAETIGRRISTIVQQANFLSGTKKLKTTITLGVAAFPNHGRNLHLLYKAGQKVLDYNRQNDIRAYAVYDPQIHDSMPSRPMKSIKSLRR